MYRCGRLLPSPTATLKPNPTMAAASSPQHNEPADGGPTYRIAVLPFRDHSAERDQAHLCEGIVEEVRADLTRVDGVEVAPRASASALKDRELPPHQAGSRLGVDAVVSGTVRRTDGRLTVEARLVMVDNASSAWTRDFDGDKTDLFGIREEIARGVVQALHLRLSDAQLRAIVSAGTRNVDAYEYYLKGRRLFFESSRKSVAAAAEMFLKAIANDPSYALAYAGMADCYAYLFMYFEPTTTNLKFARNASKHALSLDRNLAEAHAARGLAVALSERYDEAEAAFEEAIRLDPSLFEAHYFFARTCFAQGKYEQACRLYEAAAEVNGDEAQALTLLGFTYRTMGEDDLADRSSARARARLERLLDLDPDDPRANYLLADALLQTGSHEEAIRHAERAVSLDPEDSYTLYGLACVYSRLGRVDDAVAALRRAVDNGFGHKAWVENDSDFDALREDARFRRLVDGLASASD